MAEFKLGRIRFVWKGVWSSTATYIKDDVVRYGGKTYLCLLGHEAESNFYTDLDAGSWALAADGQAWAGNWAGTTFYKVGDLVKWGGQVYICKTGHESQVHLEDDTSKWDLFSSAFNWQNSWTTNNYYKVGDVVSYGATIYRCKTAHTSATTTTLGIEADSGNWDILNQSFSYVGIWSGSYRFKLNDVTKYHGELWLCTSAHTSSTSFDETKFTQLVEGLEFQNTWSTTGVYAPGDVVGYGGYTYVSTTNNTNKTPPTNLSDWTLLSTGFKFFGDWTIATEVTPTSSSSSTDEFTVSSTSNLSIGMPITFSYDSLPISASETVNSTGLITVVNSTGLEAGMPIVFNYTSYSLTATTTTDSNDQITLSNLNGNAGLSAGMPVVFNFTPVSATASATFATGNFITLDDVADLYTGQPVVFSGTTFGNIGANTTYYVKSITDTTPLLLTSVARAGNLVTVVTATATHNLVTGQTATISGTGLVDQTDVVVTVTAADTFTFVSSSSGSISTTSTPSGVITPAPQISISATNNGTAFTLSNDSGSMAGTFGGVFGNIVAGTTYYVKTTVNSDKITISATNGGGTFNLIDAVGYMTATAGGVFGNIVAGTTYYVKSVPDGQHISISETNDGTTFTLANAVGSMTAVAGGVFGGVSANTTYYVLSIRDSQHFTISSSLGGTAFALDGYIGSMTGTAGGFYQIGNVVRLNGYTYLCTTDNTASSLNKPPNDTYWQLLNPGYKWIGTWASGDDYVLGDTVKYSNFTYICVLAHTSSTPTRPDNDLVGTYWNLLTGGAESTTLTTQGDLLYYSQSGPARLPVGTDGQVLKVNGSTLSWATWGKVTGVYYVAPNGTDTLTYDQGTTLDKPWKTVRYACQNVTGPATIFIKTGTYNETLPIIVPVGVSLVGDELRTVVIQPAGSLISATDVPYSLDALTRVKAVISDIVQNTLITKTTGNALTQDVSHTAGAALAGTAAADLVQDAYDWVDYYINSAGSSPTRTGSNTATGTSGYAEAAIVLASNRDFIAAEAIAYIKDNYFIYDSDKCSRDIGLIIDATCYDLVLGTNYNRVTSGLAYRRSYSSVVISSQLANTVSALNYAKNLALTTSVNSDATVTAVFAEVIDILQNGSASADALTWTTPSSAPAGAANANALLVSNRQFLIDEITAYMNTNYSAFWTALTSGQRATCARDVGYIVDAVCYDVLYGGNSATVGAASAYYNGTTTLVPNEQAETGAAIERLRVVARDVILNTTVVVSAGNVTAQVTDVPNPGTATQQTQIDTLLNAVHEVVSYGTAYLPTVTYPDVSWGTTNAKNDRTLLLAAKSSIQSSTITYINTPIGSGGLGGYSFNVAACSRDVVEYVKAIEYDLVYTGNYKTLLAADWYVGAQTGSSLRNMFFMRNGTILRNMTLQGLSGSLGSANGYGTQRPSAGAYVSLDPGFGTGDTSVQITTKSPYVQNVTTFGTACVGLKIDGSLHDAGNKSIVANDFTQILSDGIGVWCTNLGRTELVSVFTYYNHIGYLAENGGKIRATNGNNSYGKWGSVSEGVDATETPFVATVNNRAAHAQIATTFSNSANILRLEYSNAGSGYTKTGNTYTFTGGNISAEAIGDEIRDSAVFEVRVLTTGAGYVSASNYAQTGSSSGSITLANTDNAVSSAYLGMRVVILSGTGVGQYGYIQSYNSGTKIATIYKESTSSAGWDHVVPGTTIASALDSTSVYIVEPRVTLSAPSYTATARTLSQSGSWVASAYVNDKFVAIATGSALSTYSSNGTSWTNGGALPASTTWTSLAAGPISTTNYFVAVASGGTQGAYSTNGGTTWTATGALPTSATWSAVGYAESTFVAIASGSQDSAYSVNGTTWTAGGSLPSNTTWTAIAGGKGMWVAVAGAGSATTTAAYSLNGGVNWTASTLPTSANWTSVAWGNGRFVAVAQGSTSAAYSIDGINWTASTLPGSAASWKEIRYGQGMFLAITGYGAVSSSVAASSPDGINWTARTLSATATWSTLAFGNPSSTPIWAMAATGGTVGGSIPNFATGLIRAVVASGQFAGVKIIDPGSGYASAPTMTVADPSATTAATWTVRTGNGALGNPSFSNRGTGYLAASATVTGAGYQDAYQTGYYLNVKDLTGQPVNGANVYIDSISGTVYKLVQTNSFLAMSTTAASGTSASWSVAAGVSSQTITLSSGNVTGSIISGQSVTGSGIPLGATVTSWTPGTSTLVIGGFTNQTFLASSGITLSFYNFQAALQISPALTTSNAPPHGDAVSIRLRYSQNRLTGHDFLSIGTGNITTTNYPNTPLIAADSAKQTTEFGGGRVFFTSTDQDGNFNVGNLFSVQQATGSSTLNASQFNLSGLNSLQLGSISLGSTNVAVTQFSTDATFAANSDTIVPTQRAIRSYISSQIGGGGANLNVNTLTVGTILVGTNSISTTSGGQINVTSKMYFKQGVDGSPLALNYFLLK